MPRSATRALAWEFLVHPALRTRRAAGLLIAGTVGLSSAVLGTPGVAVAAPSTWTFSDADGTSVVVPDQGICAIDWTLSGSRGGAGIDEEPAPAPTISTFRTAVGPGATFTLAVGAPGADAFAGGAGGTNPEGAGAWNGGDAYNGDSGGGGAASVVLRNGLPYLASSGGPGAGPNHGGGAAGYAGMQRPIPDEVPPTSQPAPPASMADGVSQGSITGTGVACGTFSHNPLVPDPGSVYVQPGSKQLTVMFETRAGGFNPVPADTTYEYSLDGTTWKPTGPTTAATFPYGTPALQFVLRGLVDDKAYVVHVRATNSNGVSHPMYSAPVKPFTRPSEPTRVEVAEGPASLVVSWAPPTEPGTYGLAGYEVRVQRDGDVDGGPDSHFWCETDAAARTCVFAVPAGARYTVEVLAVANRLQGHPVTSESVVVRSGVVPSDTDTDTDTDSDVVVGRATNVVATTSPTSITVTWGAPTARGDHEVAGYVVGWGLGNRGDTACEVAATAARTCTFTAEAGLEYTVSVFTVDTEGNTGEPVRVVVTAGVPVAVPMPATVPASNGTIARPAGETGAVTQGETVTLRGTGYAPHTAVTVAIYSEPRVLTTVFTDENGAFEVTVTIPEGLAAGEHTLVASGVDEAGNVRNLTLPVTVAADGEAALASTGADTALPLAGGAAALLLGGGLLVAARRRTTA
jgi:hypothetical protein